MGACYNLLLNMAICYNLIIIIITVASYNLTLICLHILCPMQSSAAWSIVPALQTCSASPVCARLSEHMCTWASSLLFYISGQTPTIATWSIQPVQLLIITEVGPCTTTTTTLPDHPLLQQVLLPLQNQLLIAKPCQQRNARAVPRLHSWLLPPRTSLAAPAGGTGGHSDTPAPALQRAATL